MKKNIRVLFLFLLGFSAIHAQLLWKISGNGLKHPSYLFGTQNLISIQFLDSVPGLFKAFNECDVVVGETVLNRIDVTGKLQHAAIMPNRMNIKDLLNDGQYKAVDNELKSVMKFSISKVSIMNPTLIRNLYKTEIYKNYTGFKDDRQSDSYFQLVAAEKNKKILGLETVDQQIKNLYRNSSLERQADILAETALHKDRVLTEMILLNKAYKAGKIEELVDISKAKGNITDMTEEEYTNLIDNRNADWMTKLPAMMKDSSCFITIDAIHLGGRNGLIKHLEKAGYKVKAVE